MDELLQAQEKNTEETRLYEVGYHLVPSIALEALGEEVVKIKDRIAAHGGVVTAEEIPKKTQLSYRLPHLLEGGRRVFFDSSYFGWVRFQMPAEEASALAGDLKTHPSLIRFILIVATPEKVSATAYKMPFFSSVKRDSSHKKEEKIAAEGNDEAKDRVRDTLSEAELDKTIEELIAE